MHPGSLHQLKLSNRRGNKVPRKHLHQGTHNWWTHLWNHHPPHSCSARACKRWMNGSSWYAWRKGTWIMWRMGRSCWWSGQWMGGWTRMMVDLWVWIWIGKGWAMRLTWSQSTHQQLCSWSWHTSMSVLGRHFQQQKGFNRHSSTSLSSECCFYWGCSHVSLVSPSLSSVHGCQGDFWKYTSHTAKWEGNLVFESDFKAYYESLKNCDNQTGTSTQVLPMLLKDLKMIINFLDSPDAAEHTSLMKQFYFKAFTTTAFTLWTRFGQSILKWIHYTNCAFRNDKLINLRIKHVQHCVSPAGTPFLEFWLVFQKMNKDLIKYMSEFLGQMVITNWCCSIVQVYQVPVDLDNHKIDCYTHMSTWLHHLQDLLGHPLVNSDLSFQPLHQWEVWSLEKVAATLGSSLWWTTSLSNWVLCMVRMGGSWPIVFNLAVPNIASCGHLRSGVWRLWSGGGGLVVKWECECNMSVMIMMMTTWRYCKLVQSCATS